MNKSVRRFVTVLAYLSLAFTASACTFATSQQQVNPTLFANTNDFQQRVSSVTARETLADGSVITHGDSRDTMFKKLGITKGKKVSIAMLPPTSVFTYMCGSQFSQCMPKGDFIHLNGYEIDYIETNDSVSINPSVSATFRERGHNLKIVAIFDDRYDELVHPYPEGVADIRTNEKYYVTDLLATLFKTSVGTGVNKGVSAGMNAVLP